MTLVFDRPHISVASRQAFAFLSSDWLRRRRARRRRIKALKDLIASPDWLLADIGVSRDDLYAELERAERGKTSAQSAPDRSTNENPLR